MSAVPLIYGPKRSYSVKNKPLSSETSSETPIIVPQFITGFTDAVALKSQLWRTTVVLRELGTITVFAIQ